MFFLKWHSGTFKVKIKATEKSTIRLYVGTMTAWLDIHKEFDLLWSLICSDVLLSVYSPLRIQAYVNQLKSKYKMTIDIFIVRA